MELAGIIERINSIIIDNKLVLYPFGNNGFMIKMFLNSVLHVKEHALIDNKLSEYVENCFSIDALNMIPDMNECIYLITSDKYPFSKYLINQSVPASRIINPFIGEQNLMMDCFIEIIKEEKYRIIQDYNDFLFEMGQISELFYSTIEDKYYRFKEKRFVSNGEKPDVPEFYRFYVPRKEKDVLIAVLDRSTKKGEIDILMNTISQTENDAFVISVENIREHLNSYTNEYRYSYLYVYSWRSQ